MGETEKREIETKRRKIKILKEIEEKKNWKKMEQNEINKTMKENGLAEIEIIAIKKRETEKGDCEKRD